MKAMTTKILIVKKLFQKSQKVKKEIREDKTCQNCGHLVEERFCSHCGQENVESRKSFHILFVDFFEDFIHYDGKFWQTIRTLVFSPAKLTKEYLAGKRKSYVSPAQLYIFISFVTFFLPSILPDFHNAQNKSDQSELSKSLSEGLAGDSLKQNPAIKINYDGESFLENTGISLFGLKNIKRIEELDSIQQTLPKAKKLSFIKYTLVKRLLTLKQMKNPEEKIVEAIKHNFSKFIFLYMPVFAFWLWLFHSKKRWLYFDHGVYTLHYFSLILFFVSLYIFVYWVFSIFHLDSIFGDSVAMMAMTLYFIYYFFHSHRKMYLQSKAKSRLTCLALFLINTLNIVFAFLLYIVTVIWISAT